MIRCEGLVKIYKTRDLEVMALQGLDLTIERGEFTAIIGNSGSGKSTFLNMIGGLDRPSAGSVVVDGQNLLTLDDAGLVRYKRETVGFVWQNNARNLLPYLNSLQNVMLPMRFETRRQRRERRERGHGHSYMPGASPRERAVRLLETVGLGQRMTSRPAELSGGEQQRLAIAIALANEPPLLLGDEPTGSVDVQTANELFELFRRLNQELGLTIVVVTHDKTLSEKVRRVIQIQDGRISREHHMDAALDYAAIQRGAFTTGLDPEAWNTRSASAEVQQHEEFLILDRAGRLQIPREILEQEGFDSNRVRMHAEGGRIILEPPDATQNSGREEA
ncbi:MAG: ABC transporter ATP-binding protein [Bacillota bacterium]|nr:ABC transporter ATP-binding protein [Bacillota bacterium]